MKYLIKLNNDKVYIENLNNFHDLKNYIIYNNSLNNNEIKINLNINDFFFLFIDKQKQDTIKNLNFEDAVYFYKLTIEYNIKYLINIFINVFIEKYNCYELKKLFNLF